MSSQKQLDANRANAQKSTGPLSPESKAKTRLNAKRDGITGQVITLSEEDLPVFEKLKAELIAELTPKPSPNCASRHPASGRALHGSAGVCAKARATETVVPATPLCRAGLWPAPVLSGVPFGVPCRQEWNSWQYQLLIGRNAPQLRACRGG